MTASEKSCRKCGEVKPAERFSLESRNNDGLRSWCRDCTNKATRESRAKPENNRRRLIKKYLWLETNHEKQRQYKLKYNQEHRKDRYKPNRNTPNQICRNKTRWLILKGVIPKQESCSKCGSKDRVEVHHLDYSSPYNIEWLCCRCHKKNHRKYQVDLTHSMGEA